MLETIGEYFKNLGSVISSFTVFDFFDICLVTALMYSVIKFIRQTRAFQLVKGLVLLVIVYGVTSLLNMQASTYIMNRLFSDALIVLIFIFQPEIRHALESMGRSSLYRAGLLKRSADGTGSLRMSSVTESLCRACSDMSDKKIGALIVCERDTMLGEIAETGSTLDAVVTAEMLENIFYPKAPLHDGAAIIRGDRIEAAGCILPLTDDPLTSDLGTRHRAAVGVSERSDAMVIVVSEETGAISVAVGGILKRNISDGALREKLTDYFEKRNDVEDSLPVKVIRRLKKLSGKKSSEQK